MKGNFDQCLEQVLEHEGGYVNHPEDPGGRTNMGITQAVYEKHLGRPVTEKDMREIPFEHVKEIYKEKYWDKVCAEELPEGLDFSVFDWAVNSGPSRAVKTLQRIIAVTQDGAIGPITLKAIGAISPGYLIHKYGSEREMFYRRLSTFTTFGEGWLNRLDRTQKKSYEMMCET